MIRSLYIGKYLIFFLLLVFAVLITIMYMMPNIRIISFVNIVSFLVLSYMIYKKQKELFTPLLLVIWSLYIFHSGHLWVSLLKADSVSYLLNFGYSSSESELIHLYRLLTNILILFGCVGLCTAKETVKIRNHPDFSLPSWFHTCVIILYIVMMYFEVQRAGNVSVSGYGDGYHYSNTFALMLADWVNILLITMMYVYGNNPKLFWTYTNMLLLRALFIMFFVGNRGSSVIQIITAVFIISRFSYISEKKAKLKQIIYSMFFFLVIALPLISVMRSGISYSEVFSDQGPIESFLVEFGDTARNTFLVDGFINLFGPVYGLQILSTSLTIFPMSTILFGDMINQYGMVGSFLNEFYNMKGLGGSMFAQLYFNFGNSIWLYAASVLMAMFTAWVSNTLMTKDNSIYKTLIFLGLFIGLITNVRGEWYSTMSCLKISLYLCVFLWFFAKKV